MTFLHHLQTPMLKCVLRIFCHVSFEEMLSARLVNWTPFYINTSKSSSSLLGDVFFWTKRSIPNWKTWEHITPFRRSYHARNSQIIILVWQFAIFLFRQFAKCSHTAISKMWTICKRVMRKFNCSWLLLRDVPHICHFFTRAKVLENKIYTEKTRKLRQNTQKIANFLCYYGKIHSKLPSFALNL